MTSLYPADFSGVPAGTVMQHDYEVTTQPFRGSGLLDREDDEKGRKLPLIGRQHYVCLSEKYNTKLKCRHLLA